jgi:hypothetical protein
MLFKLLTAPITAPVSGLNFVLKQVVSMAERELMDVDRLHQELLLLNMRLEEGEITQAEFAAQEADVLARLRAAREYAQKKAGR